MDVVKLKHRRAHDHQNRKRVPQQNNGGILTVTSMVTITGSPADASVTPTPTSIAPTTSVFVEKVTTSATPVTVSITMTPKTHTVTPTTFQLSTTKRKTSSSDSASSSLKSSSKSSSSVRKIVPSTTMTAHQSVLAGSNTMSTISSITSSASTSVTSTAAPSSGLSAGAYAGIIGGGVGVALLLLGIFALVYRRKQTSKNFTKLEDEKAFNRRSAVFDNNDRGFSPSPVQNSPAKPPRLSLAPMTNFMPGLASPANGNSSNQSSRDVPGGLSQPPAALMLDNLNEKDLSPGQFAAPAPSPALSAFSDSTSNGGPASPSPVHRIMIDFNPSMGDELELRTGELVRMLHEYDDGWALCIRMDRSQQGVCPRTCLSQRPVKPRPPPGAPQQQGRQGHPSGNPNSAREPSNMNGPPRPQNDSRPSSPAMNGGGRPQSPGVGPRNGAPIKIRQPTGGQRTGPSSPRVAPGTQRPESPSYGRQPHPLSKMQKEDDVEFHAM